MNATSIPSGTPSVARPRGGTRTEKRFEGFAAAAGVAIGPVFRATEPDVPVTETRIEASAVAAEGARLDAAIVQSRKQLGKLVPVVSVLHSSG